MLTGLRNRWLTGIAPASLLAALALSCSPARAAEDCPHVPAPPVTAPRTQRAIESGAGLVIVALGSSTTQGAMASDRAHTYPAVLQAALSAALPSTHVAVLNRGINGQDATEELQRMETDVIAARPSLVIWQVGANGALHQTDPALFRQQIMAGVDLLQAAGADVVLMDNQRAPAILAAPRHAGITYALTEVAAETGADLFSRNELMSAWEQDGYAPALFLAPDGLHHNDRGYRCVAQALATALVEGLTARSARISRAATRPPGRH